MSIQPANAQVSSLRMLDGVKLTPVKISEADEEMYQRLVAAQEQLLEMRYSKAPDLSNNPAYALYATVRVNGKVVAEIDNNGFVTTSNAMGARITRLLSDADETGEGPKLAQARAELIARELGGTVVKASTALTQNQFSAIPSRPPRWTTRRCGSIRSTSSCRRRNRRGRCSSRSSSRKADTPKHDKRRSEMKVDNTPSAHSFHYAQSRASEHGKGKASESPAFQARAGLGESGDVPFGKLVSEIAKARKNASTPDVPPAPGLPTEA